MEIIQTLTNLEKLVDGLRDLENNLELDFEEGHELAAKIENAIQATDHEIEELQDRVAKLDDAADSVINLLDEHELEIHELSELYALANELRDAIQAIR